MNFQIKILLRIIQRNGHFHALRINNAPLFQLKGIVVKSQRNRADVVVFVLNSGGGNAGVLIIIGHFKFFSVKFNVIGQNQTGRNIVIINIGNLIQLLIVINDVIAVADNQNIGRSIVFHAYFVGFGNIEHSFRRIAVAGRLHERSLHGFNVVQVIFNLFQVLFLLSLSRGQNRPKQGKTNCPN